MRKRIGTFILAFILTFLSEFQSYAGEISGDRGAVLKNTEDQVSLTESDVVFEEGEVEEVGGVEDGENNLDNSVIESEEGENSGQGQGEEPVQEPEEGENSGQGQGEEPVQEPEEGENSGQGQGEEPVQEPEEGENSEQGQGEEAVQEPEEENSEKNQEEELKENEVGNSDEGIDEEFEALNDPLYSRYMQMPVFIGEEVKSSSLVHDSRFDKYEKIQGIDVSKYQGDINWGAVKNSGVDFAMIRLGYRGMQAGTLQLDSQFTNNIEGAHAAGVQIGIYFFTQAVNTAEAEEEAQYVIDWLSQYPDYVSYPVIIDIEAAAGSRLDNAGLTANEKTAICRTFCEKIQRAGYTAGIYSNKNYLETQLNINELADSFYIWLAHYTNQTSYAGRYNMWQYTSSGTVSGISGYVDMDIAYISTAPQKVQGIKQTAATTDSITLSWNPVANADGYKVYRYNTSGTLVQSYNVTDEQTTNKNLEEGTTYQYKVRAFYLSADGIYTYGAYSDVYSAYTTPGQVENLTVEKQSENSITLSWKNLSGAVGYRVSIYNEDTKKYEVAATTTQNSYTVTGLSSGKNYIFKVQGYVNLNGSTMNKGVYSDTVSAYTIPAQITGLTKSAITGSSVILRWAKQTGITGYRVYCYDGNGALLSAYYTDTNSFTHSGVETGQSYQYRVRAYLSLNSDTVLWGNYSEILEVKTKPVQVSGLYESSAATDRIVVKWTAVEGADGYRVCLYDESTKKYTILGTTSSCSYTIKDLSPATRYNVRVAAYVKNGSKLDLGTYSSSLEATTKPTAVTGVKQTAKSIDSITITWNTLKNVDGYRVYCYDQDGKLLSSLYVEENMYTATDVSGKYIYKVRAYIKMKGYTAWGDYSSGLQVYTKPVQVSGLYESSAATDRIVVKWTAVEGADGYRVCLYDESTKKYTILGTTSSCSYTIKDLSPATRYNVRVAAYVKNGSKLDLGVYSPSLKAVTKPETVTNVKRTAMTADSITITWTALKNVSGYRVYCYDTNGKLLSSPYTTSNTYTVTGVSDEYVYRVRAYIKTEDYTAWGDYSKDDVDEKLEFQTGTLLQPSECTAVSYNGASLTVKIQTGRNSSLETLKGTYGIVLLNSAGTEMQEWKSGTVTNDNGFSVSAIFSSNDGFRMAAMGKFAIAVKNGSSVKVISDLEYLSNPDIFASKEESFKDKYMGYYEGYKITSKKGIQGASMSYTEDLRVQHVFLNVDIAEMVRESKTSGYVPYTYKGRTYYFQDLIALKDTIYDLHGWGSTDGNAYGENHIRAVTLNLLLSWDDTLSYLIHPSARVKGAASYYTLNMKEERARDTFEALFCYMGEELGQYKERVTNWTLGNEVNSCRVWNYSGAMSLEDCVENYAEAFQLLYQGVKRTAGSSRLFISLDHCWTTSDAGHSGKAYLDAFAAYMNETAPTMQWNVNYHSYSQPLSRNDFWNDYSNTTDSLNTKYISMRNIQVLTDYLGTLETKYGKANGSIRVIIGELGYSAAGGNTEQEDLQAAALGYGYYKAMFNTRIDAYIIRAYLDDPAETSSGLHLGLRRNDGAQTKKVAYDVYQNLDTNQSLNYMNKYLGIIGIGSWQSAISGFDASKLPASDF